MAVVSMIILIKNRNKQCPMRLKIIIRHNIISCIVINISVEAPTCATACTNNNECTATDTCTCNGGTACTGNENCDGSNGCGKHDNLNKKSK